MNRSANLVRRRPAERGGIALSLTLHLSVVLLGLSVAMIKISTSGRQEYAEVSERVSCSYVAEAGVANAVLSLYQGGTGALGSTSAGVAFGKGSYRTTCVNNGNGTYTVTSYGTLGDDVRALRAAVQKTGGIFNHSMFAGDSSGDKTYAMKFGGTGASADHIAGDVYSGNNIAIAGAAALTGTLQATGSISGGSGQTGLTQPAVDLAAMNYPSTADVKVAADFASSSTYQSNAAGGSAWQVPQSMPSHIFRLNPSDRTALTATTVKDDYFLEDPYQTVHDDAALDGSNAYMVKLSGSAGTPGTDGSKKTYYVDGNLWIDNLNTMSMKFGTTDAQGTQITIVVKGNIYVADNLFVSNAATDGVGLIAMKDSAVSDSGNIYFGDPTLGTLNHMQAFMYAENNFYDNNLDALGSLTVTLDGIMAAGNQIAVNRDFGLVHTKLTLNYDARLANKTLNMPGMGFSGGSQTAYKVVSLMEVAPQ